MSERQPVVIVGAGLAGLCCARALQALGEPVLVLEAADGVGGRVRTDEHEGFLLDRGFQVLQTAYPEAQRMLDYRRLQLRAFEPGALIWTGGRLVRMSDPWRRPSTAWSALTNGVGTYLDRWKLLQLRRHVVRHTPEQLLAEPDMPTRDYLRQHWGFSDDLVQRFFRPWFSGVFLETELATASRFFAFTFRMFALGDASLPEVGMGAIPAQLAQALPSGTIRLQTRVAEVQPEGVRLADGTQLAARAVVLATDCPSAVQLSHQPTLATTNCSTICFYFAASQPPVSEPILILNGDGRGPINHLTVPSNVSARYAPADEALISVSVVGLRHEAPDDLRRAVQEQLAEWFGPPARQWRHLRTYTIEHALPAQPAGTVTLEGKDTRLESGVYCCGDHRQAASIQGAMLSGRKTAERIHAELKLSSKS
jgi:phytoene dehydrogenase-like protein